MWASLEACPAGHGCDDALTGVFLSRKTDVGFSVLSLLCPGGGSLAKSCPLQQPHESQDEPLWPPAPGASIIMCLGVGFFIGETYEVGSLVGVSPPGLQLQNHRATQVHGLPQEMQALAASGEAEASVKRAPGSRRPQRASRLSCECATPDAGPWGRKLQDRHTGSFAEAGCACRCAARTVSWWGPPPPSPGT